MRKQSKICPHETVDPIEFSRKHSAYFEVDLRIHAHVLDKKKERQKRLESDQFFVRILNFEKLQ